MTTRRPDPPICVPFNRSAIEGNELVYVQEAISRGHISADGPFTKRCQELLEQELGVTKALLTTSCTDALEMAALLLDLQPGDEVVVPSFTFVSTANAFALRGARPRFVDVRPDTLNIDEDRLTAALTPETKAVIVVHYAGVGCNMQVIGSLADEAGVVVVEDNAHGLFGAYKNKPLGSIGQLATLSFHETKNFTCGEGGALLLNEASYVERAEVIRQKGTDRSRFERGEVSKYTWVDLGSSHAVAEILSAYLLGQLEARDKIQASRRARWDRYATELADWAAANDVRLPVVPDDCEQTYHLFYLLLPTGASRDRFIKHMRDSGILAVFHYVPLHLSSMGRRFGGYSGECPVTEDISQRLVRLPLYSTLSASDQALVIESVSGFKP
jgi:dTDP-4-amino-4,6-dideoxygalactose transaminase